MHSGCGRVDPVENETDRDRDLERTILACAWYLSLGLNQSQIGSRLGIAQPTVSRHLKAARTKGWLTEQVLWPPDLDLKEREAIVNQGFAGGDKLLKRLRERSLERKGVPLGSLHVIPAAGEKKDVASLLEDFGRGAGPILAGILDQTRSQIIAAAWGRTLSSVVRYMPRRGPRVERVVVPVAGEPLNHPDRELSSTRVVRELATACGTEDWRSLQGVPARIPKALKDHAGGIKAFVERSHAYREIFIGSEGDDGLLARADCIITGIGSVDTSARGPHPDPLFLEITEVEQDPANDTPEKVQAFMQRCAIGNAAGWWIPREGISREEQELIEDLNERSFGLKVAHLRQCATRTSSSAGHDDEPAGVICLAVEPEKAAVVWEVLGLINRLIISDSLADALQVIADEHSD
jgi:DNA-binding transcriptional regulator LsrR (DeoR family)